MQDKGDLSPRRRVAPAQASTSCTLLERVKAKDAEGWRRLLALYRPLVLWWCDLKGLPAEDAEDVAQEVFQAVAGRVADFAQKEQGGGFRSWLHRITDHKVGDWLRRRPKQPQAAGGSGARQHLDEMAAAQTPVGGTDVMERALLVRSALALVRAEFEVKTWDMAWRVMVDGHRPQDVAAELGLKASAVYTARSRVASRLRAELEGLLE